MAYLDLIDGILRGGAHALGEEFGEVQRAWIECLQQPDGGFAGRRGASDLYYTDFGLRALDLVAPESPVFRDAARHLRWNAREPSDLIEAFSLLSCVRTLGRHGLTVSAQRPSVRSLLDREALPEGGFRAPGSNRLSAYRSFLGALCLQLLGDEAHRPETLTAVVALQRESGGFAERADEDGAQTSATAAAVALLLMGESLEREQVERAADFIASMQADDGGLRAHRETPCGDMLSTFTGLLTLCLLGAQGDLDLPLLARFVRNSAHPGGGFGAGPHDEAADVEYTYYGIASLALMRAVLEADD